MLDQLNYLNQFHINNAWRQLEAVLQASFLAETPDFSGLEVTFGSPKLSLGLEIALTWLDNPQFQWQAQAERTVIIDGESFDLPEVTADLADWRDLLLCLKLAGIDIWTALQQAQEATQSLAPTVATSDNPAKQLALRLAGKIGLIISAEQLRPVGDWWRQCLEQRAVNLCFSQSIDQLNNRGWQSHPIEKPFAVIDLPNHQDQVKFDRKNRQLSGKMPASYQFKPVSDQPVEQLLELLLMAEATSFYLAVLNKQSLNR